MAVNPELKGQVKAAILALHSASSSDQAFVGRYNASEAANVGTARLLFGWSVALLTLYSLCLLYLLAHALYFEWLFAPTTQVLDSL